MITCNHAQNLFDTYLNDELSPSLVTELDAHVLRCSDCRQQLSLLEACGHVVRLDTSEPEVTGDFTDRLVAILEDEPATRSSLMMSRGMKIAASLVGMAACVGLTAFVMPGRNTPNPRSTTPEVLSASSPAKHTMTLPGAVLGEFLGAPLPLLSMPQSVSGAIQLGELTLDKMSDAAAVDGIAPSQPMPLNAVPNVGPDAGPDVLETLPSIDDDGELM